MKPHTYTNRSLCECDLYIPNYDNDAQMKEVMENFNKQTQQRFHEYDERMKTTRQKCKDKCDNDIQKIILKDKLEKELMDKFATLQTDIQNDAIPTCICEKSLADKTEKFCHNCGYGLGSVAPSIGLLGGPGIYGWKTAALVIAKDLAEKGGAAAGEAARIKAGIEAVISGIKSKFPIHTLNGEALKSVIAQKYNDVSLISGFIEAEYYESGCREFFSSWKIPICKSLYDRIFDTSEVVQRSFSPKEFIKTTVKTVVSDANGVAAEAAKNAEAAKKAAILETSTKAIDAATYNWYTTIGYSITAILIIVLIMVIIYKILRYRRKKKMKKKLQYIKLLKE
ncbi:hypothetical protein PFUGPA_05976 [Plasmodium falciparum Palo Alto/Uganda]|uniref:Rifin n=1 Tax=Plasmodium falciparum (isolate Palo Alto / Uganda) TaxID=57270 RepID=W4IPR3_PLAFP|nr:hypothetical protein PFUGPA_05976 [Plasmodium falciparum Palo Alto/Uganda]